MKLKIHKILWPALAGFEIELKILGYFLVRQAGVHEKEDTPVQL